MIPEIIIEDNFDDVYDLTSIGLEGELVINGDDKYIITSDTYFPFNSPQPFEKIDDYYILKNDEAVFKISPEKYEIIKNILNS